MPKGKKPHPDTVAALVAYNKERSVDWAAVDWTLPNRVIAAQFGRAENTVAKIRMRFGKSGVAVTRMTRCDKGCKNPRCRRPNTRETQEMAVEAAKASALAGKTETNIHAKEWVLIAPNGQVYRIRNLYHFVRSNLHLFAPADVEWKRQGGKRGTGGEYCNATAGLQNIKGGKAKTWKGWKLGFSAADIGLKAADLQK